MRPSLPTPPPLLASDHLFWAEFSELRSLSRKSTEGARVKHVMHARTNEQYAVKEIDKGIRGRGAIVRPPTHHHCPTVR